MQVGDLVKLKNQPLYGTMKVHEILPKGSLGHNFIPVKVLHSSSINEKNWNFAVIKTFKKSQLEKIKE